MPSGYHTSKSSEKDVLKIVEQLEERNVFSVVSDRKHRMFNSLKQNIFSDIDKKKLDQWLLYHTRMQIMYN